MVGPDLDNKKGRGRCPTGTIGKTRSSKHENRKSMIANDAAPAFLGGFAGRQQTLLPAIEYESKALMRDA